MPWHDSYNEKNKQAMFLGHLKTWETWKACRTDEDISHWQDPIMHFLVCDSPQLDWNGHSGFFHWIETKRPRNLKRISLRSINRDELGAAMTWLQSSQATKAIEKLCNVRKHICCHLIDRHHIFVLIFDIRFNRIAYAYSSSLRLVNIFVLRC